jgi:hypothetical protein
MSVPGFVTIRHALGHVSTIGPTMVLEDVLDLTLRRATTESPTCGMYACFLVIFISPNEIKKQPYLDGQVAILPFVNTHTFQVSRLTPFLGWATFVILRI